MRNGLWEESLVSSTHYVLRFTFYAWPGWLFRAGLGLGFGLRGSRRRALGGLFGVLLVICRFVLRGAEIVRVAGSAPAGHPPGRARSLAVGVDRLAAVVARPLPVIGHAVPASDHSLAHCLGTLLCSGLSAETIIRNRRDAEAQSPLL